MFVAGSCHCGQCICNPQDWWASGEYCECDDRECDKHDGLICTGDPYTLEMSVAMVNPNSITVFKIGEICLSASIRHIHHCIIKMAEDIELASLILV